MKSRIKTLKAQLQHEQCSSNELRTKVTMYKRMSRSFWERQSYLRFTFDGFRADKCLQMVTWETRLIVQLKCH